MDVGIAAVAAAGLAAWGTVMATVLQRTNGSGPLATKLLDLKDDVLDLKNDVRSLKQDLRDHLHGDGK